MLRLLRSFSFAFNGLKLCISKEANFKIHTVCTFVVIALGVYFKITVPEWMILLLCIGFVLCMEMINTAIEQLSNVVQKDIHAGIKATKDISAAAVLMSAIVAAVTGAIIFIPKFILLF